MSTEKIKVVKIDTDPAKKSVKDLRNEIKELKDQMANLEEGSNEFLELANKAGEAKHQIDEINESIKGASSDFGDMVGNVTNVAAGITGAFQAVAGGLQAMGMSSEALDKTIAQMQGLMAVTQGLAQMDTAIKSLDKLRNSITSTTTAAKLMKAALQPKVFLAITAVVAGLTFAFNKLKGKIDEVKREQEEYNRKLQEERELNTNNKMDERLRYLNRELRIKEAIASVKYGDDELKYKKEMLKAYTDELTRAEANVRNSEAFDPGEAYWNNLGIDRATFIEGLKKERDQIKKLREQTEDDIAVITAKNAELAKLPKKPTNTETPEDKEAKALAESNRLLDIKLEKLKHSGKTEKEIIEETIKIEQERLELYKGKNNYALEYEKIETDIFQLQADLLQQTEEITEAELNAQAAKAQYELEGEELIKKQIEIETKRLTLIDAESAEYWNQMVVIKALNAELTALGETTDGNLDKRKEYLRSVVDEYLMIEKRELNTPKEYKRVLEEIDEARKLDLINEEEHVQAKARAQEVYTRNVISQTSQVVSATSSMLTGLLDGLAAQQDTTNKEGFEKSKKLQIASATIQMLTGITTALAGAFTSKTGVWDFILAGIQAATIATTGALNINKIKQTKFDGGGVTPSVSASAINNTIVPPVQFSNAVQGAATEGAIKDTKVYVLESDIRQTGKKVETQENENTY